MKTCYQILLLATLATGLVSCGSVLRRDIEVRAIDREGNDVKSLIVVGHQWPSEDTPPEDLHYTTAKVEVTFQDESTPARIRVKPLFVEEDGSLQDPCPRELAPAPFKGKGRDLLYTDPGIVLFILEEEGTGFGL